jgi:RHS repeat-associated protein
LAGKNKQLSAHEKLAEISRKYNWDKSGRLIGVKDNKRGASSYHYDPRDQINRITRTTGLDKQVSEQYSYDSLLNLVESNGRHHQYENGEVKSIGRSSYRHDSRGRVVEKRVVKHGFRPRTWYYRWDDFDRLIETHTQDSAIWRYTYDAFGRRMKKECVKAGESSKKSSVTYIWQCATLAEEIATNGDTSETTRWHFEPGTFTPLAKETSGNFYPIVTDHLGTPKELFDTDGNCVWQAEHSLWGETEVSFARKPDGYQPLVDCNLRFQNQWEDKETGLYYNLNRYYDPDSGLYLSTDPIGLDGGLRTHGYVHDPMQWVDPLGLAGCSKKAIVVGEGMGRVNKAVKDLRSQGINVKKYQTWKKNWPNDRRLTPSEEATALARNNRWINTKIKQGYDIYDIGPDGRAVPSPFYQVEQNAITTNSYPTIKISGY